MAAWKPKEKELTPEEAIVLARKELAPFWHGSGPLLAGAKDASGQVNAVPIDPEFTQKSWLIFLVDPLSLEGVSALRLAKTLYQRYSGLDLRFLMVMVPTFSFQREARYMESLLREFDVRYPTVLDSEGLLSRAFGAHQGSRSVLMARGGTARRAEGGPGWMRRVEPLVQGFLRAGDPGLPLRPLLDVGEIWIHELLRLDFMNLKGFQGPGPLRTGQFKGNDFMPLLKDGRLALKGAWMQDPEKIGTSDPAAEILFRSPSHGLYLMAQSLTKTNESARIVFESKGVPIYDTFSGKDLQVDDEGNTSVRVEGAALYSALKDLPPDMRELTMRFPMAGRVPVGIYGLRFSEQGLPSGV